MDTFLFPALVLVLLFVAWPKIGLWARWQNNRQIVVRRRREDVLKHLAKAEANGRPSSIESVAGSVGVARVEAVALLAEMEKESLVCFASGEPKLLPAGRDRAVQVIRAHRLWESYLAEQTGVAAKDWHCEADKVEHLLSPAAADALAQKLGDPVFDPHGDPIPSVVEAILPDAGQALATFPLGVPARIVHLEDEPRVIFAALLKLGLRPKLPIEVLEKLPGALRVRVPGAEYELPLIQAANIHVLPLADTAFSTLTEESTLERLGDGQQTRVVGLAAACRGAERRRLLDLGFVPGSEVRVEMISPVGDPTAYRVRGCLIALRREQAALVRIAKPTAAI